jgi:integrase
MADTKRRDNQGRLLKDGESQRKDGRYMYRWTQDGKQRTVYALTRDELREKEKKIKKDIEDGVDSFKADSLTVNELFDMYIATKTRLRETTLVNYQFMYDSYVRGAIGNCVVGKVKYSDIKQLYLELLEDKLSFSTLQILNNVLHPVFDLAVRDDIIRKNPTDGILKDIRGTHDTAQERRVAMTLEEQSAFMEFARKSKVYNVYVPLFVVFLGTGMRVGEALGLRWRDVDYDNNLISVNHTLTYKKGQNGKVEFKISPTKTNAGTRTIPMLPEVRQALLDERKRQFMMGGCETVIDGCSDFVFTNSNNHVHKPNTINRVIIGIIKQHNEAETKAAEKEKRKPFLIRHFSVHSFRHTFATNYCQIESNLKTIQEVMGHSTISTTMNVYAHCTEESKVESFKKLEGKFKIG